LVASMEEEEEEEEEMIPYVACANSDLRAW
jgi:hypothetical protein